MSKSTFSAYLDDPFELLQQMDLRARNVSVKSERSQQEWVGVGVSIDNYHYVIPQNQVLEVLRLPLTTRVPGSKRWLMGLSHVRGKLFPVIDVRLYCGDHATVVGRDSRIVLINVESSPVAIVVDEVFGFRRYPAKQLSVKVSDGLPFHKYVTGIFVQEENDWAVLDVVSLIDKNDTHARVH